MFRKKAIVSAVLALTLSACLITGCKKKEETNAPTGDIYVPTFSEFSVNMDGVDAVVSNGNTISVFGSMYQEDASTGAYDVFTKVVNYDLITGDKSEQSMKLDNNSYLNTIIPNEDGFLALVYSCEYNNEGDIDGPVLYDEKVISSSAVSVAEVTVAATESETTGAATEETTGDGVLDDGVVDEWFGSGTNYYEPTDETYYLVQYDKDLNEISRKDITSVKKAVEEEGGYFYFSSFAMTADGNICVCSDDNIYVMDEEGNILFKISVGTWIDSVVSTADGQVLVFYYNEENNRVVSTVDFDAKKLSDPLEHFPISNSRRIYDAPDGRFYVNGETELYLYDLKTDTAEVALNWIDCDIDSDNIVGVAVLEDGTIVAVSADYEYTDNSMKVTLEVAKLVKTPASEVKQKTYLTLSMLYLDYNVKSEIIKFNKTNPDYRITVKTYVNDDYSNYEEAVTQFSTDLASGSVSDIFVGNGYDIDVSNLASKGSFADLYQFIDKDADINREDFIPSALKALETNGKLYMIGDSFSVNTVIGATSVVGDRNGWTIKDVVEVQNKYPDSDLFEYCTRDSILEYFINYAGDSFYDSKTGECHFDSEDFVAVLELAKRYPVDFNYDEDRPSTPALLRSKKVLLEQMNIYDFEELQLYEALYSEPITVIGYPTSTGTGSSARFDTLMAISSKSKQQEGAWEFIKTFLTEEAQSNLSYTIPVTQKAFDAMLEKAKNRPSDESYSWWYDDTEVKIGKLTETQEKMIVDAVNNVSSIISPDVQLYTIISEEAAAYFEGQKSASEVASIIQSRAQIYINENR